MINGLYENYKEYLKSETWINKRFEMIKKYKVCKHCRTLILIG